jgi:hypothetical protein
LLSALRDHIAYEEGLLQRFEHDPLHQGEVVAQA